MNFFGERYEWQSPQSIFGEWTISPILKKKKKELLCNSCECTETIKSNDISNWQDCLYIDNELISLIVLVKSGVSLTQLKETDLLLISQRIIIIYTLPILQPLTKFTNK